MATHKKSKLALYQKAIKKRFIKKLGRRRGPKAFRDFSSMMYNWQIHYGMKETAKQASGYWIAFLKEERAKIRRHKRLCQPINSPGGECDPADGIYRELRTQLDMQWHGNTPYKALPIYIAPHATIAY